MNKNICFFFTAIIIFYSLPLFFYQNILPSHDERLIINLTFALPVNHFLSPVNYYGPVQSYFLLILYLPVVIFGYLFKNGGVEFIKNLYVNDYQIITLIGKFFSLLSLCGSLILILFIAKENKWKSGVLIFFGIALFFMYPLYISATIIKVESLLFFLILSAIFSYIKWNNTNKNIYFYLMTILFGIIFAAKYNMLLLTVFPIVGILQYKNKKDIIGYLIKYAVIFIITVFISLPSLIFNLHTFIADCKYIFTVINLSHIGWVKPTGLLENITITLHLFFDNLPVVFLILFVIIFIRDILKKEFSNNLPYYSVIIVFTLFLLKWNFKLSHYVIPILPFIIIVVLNFINEFSNKKIIILILLLFVSYNSFLKIVNYIKQHNIEDIRIIAQKYINENIPDGSRILLEDRYDYSPYILPKTLPAEYDVINHSRAAIVNTYYNLLLKYGRNPKYNITFLNIPLEGRRLLTFKFPNKEYLIENFDYIVLNPAISYRFKKISDTFFEKDAYNFYYETMSKFPCKILTNTTGSVIIYKINSHINMEKKNEHQ